MLRMQFGHKELCNLLWEILVAVGAAGHLQARQGVVVLQLETQRAQQPGEGRFCPTTSLAM